MELQMFLEKYTVFWGMGLIFSPEHQILRVNTQVFEQNTQIM